MAQSYHLELNLETLLGKDEFIYEIRIHEEGGWCWSNEDEEERTRKKCGEGV